MPLVPIFYRIRPRRMSSQILNRRLGIAMAALTFMRHSSALSLALVASFLVLSTILTYSPGGQFRRSGFWVWRRR